MRVVILYRPNSEFSRRTDEYITEFQRFHPGANLENISLDTIEGDELARLYGITEYPALLALANDGQMQQLWAGIDKLPLMNDLAYYANQ